MICDACGFNIAPGEEEDRRGDYVTHRGRVRCVLWLIREIVGLGHALVEMTRQRDALHELHVQHCHAGAERDTVKKELREMEADRDRWKSRAEVRESAHRLLLDKEKERAALADRVHRQREEIKRLSGRNYEMEER